jgi:ABC-type transport system substrate-binding protein
MKVTFMYSMVFLASASQATPTNHAAFRGLQETSMEDAVQCNQDHGPLTFVLLENEAVNAAVEDDIRQSLATVGFTVEARKLSKADINVARQTGDFHFSITETWGTPYDPHSYAGGWIDGKGGEGVFPAMANFDGSASREELFGLVEDALEEEDPAQLEIKWETIHKYYHAQAVMLPLWGKRVPTLMNSRLTGYEAGYQQFDYPIHRLVPLTGSTTIKIAPGARTGLFKTVGGMDAHTYGPNEFFSNNWVYEGLVAYGQGGQILPSLAESWSVEPNDIGGNTYTFNLRSSVTFHDGELWNCAAAKLNFDHLLAGNLRDRHGWYGIPKVTEDWSCSGPMTFVIQTNKKHGPYLQELSLIRPIRMISPGAFANGNSTDPTTANSCSLDWGVIEGTDTIEDVICVGITGIHGTGPYIFDSKDPVEITNSAGDKEMVDDKVIFLANDNYWGGAPAVKRVEIIRYETSYAVKKDLLNGNLDVVWGSGVLPDADIKEIQESPEYQAFIRVFHSGDVQNVILLLNSGNPPFDDINVRKTVIHAINKGAIVERELKGLQQVVDNVFPLDSPYCDVDLTPRWDFDIEKATLLSCDGVSKESNTSHALGLGLGLGLPLLVAAVLAFSYYKKSKNYELRLQKHDNAVQA